MSNHFIQILSRARENELELCGQLEHIERVRRIARNVRNNIKASERILDKLTRLETQLNEQIDKSIDIKNQALAIVNLLTGEERGVIENYYILGKTWDKIALEMYMSNRRVFFIRKRALQRLETMLKGGKSDE